MEVREVNSVVPVPNSNYSLNSLNESVGTIYNQALSILIRIGEIQLMANTQARIESAVNQCVDARLKMLELRDYILSIDCKTAASNLWSHVWTKLGYTEKKQEVWVEMTDLNPAPQRKDSDGLIEMTDQLLDDCNALIEEQMLQYESIERMRLLELRIDMMSRLINLQVESTPDASFTSHRDTDYKHLKGDVKRITAAFQETVDQTAANEQIVSCNPIKVSTYRVRTEGEGEALKAALNSEVLPMVAKVAQGMGMGKDPDTEKRAQEIDEHLKMKRLMSEFTVI